MTVILYLILVLCGWISIYAASYDFDNASIFDFAERSGKQLMWIGLSLVLAFMILMVDFRVYETYAYLFYGIIILLLIATIFLAPDIKGSRSWLVLGPVSLQPAEFAKFATALALARSFGTYGFSLKNRRDLFRFYHIVAYCFDYRSKGDRFGVGFRIVDICSVSGRIIGIVPFLWSLRRGLFCGCRQIFECIMGGDSCRRSVGFRTYSFGGGRNVVILSEKQSCGSLFDAWLFGGRSGMWHFDVFRCTG